MFFLLHHQNFISDREKDLSALTVHSNCQEICKNIKTKTIKPQHIKEIVKLKQYQLLANLLPTIEKSMYELIQICQNCIIKDNIVEKK